MDRTTVSLAAEYERLCREPSDIGHFLPTLVALVHELNAQHVIELGVRSGVSTIAWLYALETTGGRLTSVDIDPPPPPPDHPQWRFIQGDDCDPALYGQLEPADIVFVDTSHHLEHTRRELSLYKWLVRPGGRIICHDTELAWPEGAPRRDGPFPVRQAIDEFCRVESREWTNDARWPGLGIIGM